MAVVTLEENRLLSVVMSGSNESEINKSFSSLFDEDDIVNRVYKSFTYYEAYKV